MERTILITPHQPFERPQQDNLFAMLGHCGDACADSTGGLLAPGILASHAALATVYGASLCRHRIIILRGFANRRKVRAPE